MSSYIYIWFLTLYIILTLDGSHASDRYCLSEGLLYHNWKLNFNTNVNLSYGQINKSESIYIIKTIFIRLP